MDESVANQDEAKEARRLEDMNAFIGRIDPSAEEEPLHLWA